MNLRFKSLITSLNVWLRDFPRAQRIVFGAMQRIKPPPYMEDNMETIVGPWKGASAAACAEGRQFGENNTFPSYYMERRYETRAGNLGGSREGCPINHSALQSVLKNWKDAVEVIDIVRSMYVARLVPAGKPLLAADVFAVAEVCMSIPAYLLRRRDNPLASGAIPSSVGAAYKLVAGLSKIVVCMISSREPWMPDGCLPGARQLYDYAESHNLFVAEDGEACGGPERKIIDLIELALSGRVIGPRKDDYAREFVAIVGHADAMLEYGLRCAIIKLAFMRFKAEVERGILHFQRDAADGRESDRFVLDSVIGCLDSATGAVPPGLADVERRIGILDHALARLGIDGLGEAIAGAPIGESAEAAMSRSGVFNDLSARGKKAIVEFATHYLRVLNCASEFSHRQQQEVNRILGWRATAPLDVVTLSTRVSEKTREMLRRVVGMQLRDSASPRTIFGSARFILVSAD